MKFTIINLTPHEITCALSGLTFPPSGQVARVDSWYAPCSEQGGIPMFRQFFGEVIGLPEEREDVLLIVSAMVRERAEDRDDLVSPGELVRNAAGQPIGCKGFVW